MANTWIKDQMRDHIIDQIIKMIMLHRHSPYFYNLKFQLDLDFYRKTVSDGGHIQTGGTAQNKQNVIYQEDYQKMNNQVGIDEFIDAISETYYTGQKDSYGNKLYDIPSQEWVTDGTSGMWYWNWNGFQAVDTLELDEYGNTIYGNPDPGNTAQIVANHVLTDGSPVTYTLEVLTPAVDTCNDCDTPVLNLLSQLIPLETDKTLIDHQKAEEILDTTIYELLPGIQTRQERIDRLFAEFGQLLAPNPPDFDTDGAPGVDLDWDVGGNVGDLSNDYSDLYDISKLGPNAGYITRLVRHEDGVNENKSLETLRNRINPYLQDIDEIIDPDEIDDRIDYSDIAEGYLKFRGLNQSIIVRAETGELTGIENYQSDGFTITMWVRFIDKKSNGTLFNFGAPLSNGSVYGFVLETFAIGEDDCMDESCALTFGDGASPYNYLFDDTSHARFVRLVVNDGGEIYNSHVGSYDVGRLDNTNGLPHIYNQMIGVGDTLNLEQALTYTRIPTDRNEWYFIVANYNPSIVETQIQGSCTGTAPDCTGTQCNPNCTPVQNDPDYWRWNVEPATDTPGNYINNSGEGARCKVEIISKSDLLRARGYKI
tara:strand:+ start:319 stop:2103 length:1785 start_codon:yes stop_codon:yes gene_type:complete